MPTSLWTKLRLDLHAMCVFQKYKNHYVVDPSSFFFNRKHNHIRKDLQEHERKKFFSKVKKLNLQSNLKESSQSLTKALKAHDEKWQNEKDNNIIHKMQSEVDNIDSKNMSLIVKQEENNLNKITEIPKWFMPY